MTHPHSKLLNNAARAQLGPLGLRQKGRSRTWLDDRRWHVIVVEFQPSSWSKGSYLNVGAHFLWSHSGHISFDLGHRLNDGFAGFESESQFAPEADRLATAAASEVVRLRAALSNVNDVRALVTGPLLWSVYHRAIALGLSGSKQEASRAFDLLAKPAEPGPWHAAYGARCTELHSLLGDPMAFRSAVVRLINQQRLALRLPEIATPLTNAGMIDRTDA